MYWRAPTQRDFRALAGAPAKEAFHGLVTSGTARGVLAFEDGAAVGWCALGPRTDFPRTETKRSYKVADAEGVWSINCFFIRKDRRGRGIAQKLLAAAVAEGRKAGAQTFEGYPSVLAPGAKQPAAFVYKGTLSMFEAAGFRIVQRTYPGSPLVRLGPRA
jgi:GNAT superfamily N-acetyltransferase